MKTSLEIRLDRRFIEELESLSEDERLDRSTIIRKLLEKGYKQYLREKAADRYRKGEITISKAADMAGNTIWEMEKFLIDQGYISSYSVDDLEKEIKMLDL